MSNVRIKPEEQFARLLELSSPASAGSDASLGSMANLANALRAAGQSAALPAPDPVFRDALRQRLVAVASVQNDLPVALKAKASMSFRMQRRIAALAGTVAVATSFAGVGVAAARSIPGDPFYGVKRATENVQLWAARGDTEKGKRHLEFAQERLAEAAKLPTNSSHLASTLASMDSETKAGSTELISAYQSSHSTAPLATLVTFTNNQVTGLTKLASKLPADVKAKETQSLNVLGGVATAVKKVVPHGTCILCSPTSILPTHSPSHGPTTKPTAHPTKHPSDKPTGQPHSGGSSPPPSQPTKSGAPAKSPTPKPSKSGILPTLPSTLHSILNPKHKHTPIPIVSKLLGKLGLGG